LTNQPNILVNILHLFFNVIRNFLYMCDLNIKEIRKNLGVSQEKLAEMLGVVRQTVRNWEKGAIIPQSKRLILTNLLNQTKEKEKTQDPQPDERLREPNAAYNRDIEITLLRQRIADLERIISLQEKTIKLLEKSQNI
jgi:DNA-binding XRE family transcriptional regulator